MDQDGLLKARIEDRIDQCRNGYYITTTGFLDLHEQSVARSVSRQPGVLSLSAGGYPDAERRILMFVPEGMAETEEEALRLEPVLQVLHIEAALGGRKLSHRDYLGAVLGLGIERSLIGDILVRKDGAEMIVRSEIVPFLLQEFRFAGKTELRLAVGDPGELAVSARRVENIRDTVASLRLDSLISAAFRISRTDAVRLIRSGSVYVDHMETDKIDRKVEEGSVLIVRGKGKAVLAEVGGESRKGRLWVRLERYL